MKVILRCPSCKADIEEEIDSKDIEVDFKCENCGKFLTWKKKERKGE